MPNDFPGRVTLCGVRRGAACCAPPTRQASQLQGGSKLPHSTGLRAESSRGCSTRIIGAKAGFSPPKKQNARQGERFLLVLPFIFIISHQAGLLFHLVRVFISRIFKLLRQFPPRPPLLTKIRRNTPGGSVEKVVGCPILGRESGQGWGPFHRNR